MTSKGAILNEAGQPIALSETPDVSGFIFEKEDLERCSVVVSDLSQVQLGDLVVQFGSQVELGIVVGLPAPAEFPLYGGDQREFMNSIVVLSVREGFRQVTMGTWGNPSGMFGGFTRSPDKCHVRRLTKNPAGANSRGALVAWDICDTFPTKISASITNMYEQSYRGADKKTVKERWMANTGEYHILRGLQMSALNTAGARVSLFDPAQGSMEVFISGARDRGYKDQTTDGNIYKNSNCAFEIALVNDATNEAIVLGTLKKPENGIYTFKPSDSASGFYKTRVEKVFDDNRIWLDSTGNVTGIVDGKPGYYLGIRPESSTAARPGDDILLTLGIRSEGDINAFNFTYKKPDGTNESSPAEVTLSEADYLSVYDKKMLWRANLYIDEGNLDWNNVHPWNAPPTANARPNAENPIWGRLTAAPDSGWDEVRWGCNEWNTPVIGFIGTLGGQVVSIPSTKWKYGHNNHTEQVTLNAVAYDHQGWDDPFSFRKKLSDQAVLLNQWYTNNGSGFKKPVYKWPKDSDVKNPDNMTREEFGLYLDIETMKQTDLVEIKNQFRGYRDTSTKRWASSPDFLSNRSVDFFHDKEDGYKKYIFSSTYGQNVSPYKTGVSDNVGGGKAEFTPNFITGVKLNDRNGTTEGIAINNTVVYPYTPGLSDSIMMNGDANFYYPHKLIALQTAGVDCIGFVQRSYAWRNSPYDALNKPWNKESLRKAPVFWTSSETDIPMPAMAHFYNPDYAARICDTTEKYAKKVANPNTVDPDDKIIIYENFKYLVPGDVIWRSGHIMVVQKIDNPSGPDTQYIADNLKIIESVFRKDRNGCYGVVSRRTLEDESVAKKLWQIWRQK